MAGDTAVSRDSIGNAAAQTHQFLTIRFEPERRQHADDVVERRWKDIYGADVSFDARALKPVDFDCRAWKLLCGIDGTDGRPCDRCRFGGDRGIKSLGSTSGSYHAQQRQDRIPEEPDATHDRRRTRYR